MASGAPVMIAWNSEAEVISYRVWSGIDTITSSVTASALVDLPEARNATLTVTALNDAGESDHSNPLTIFLVAPVALTQNVTLDLESSEDLENWALVSTHHLIEPRRKKFYRIRITTP